MRYIFSHIKIFPYLIKIFIFQEDNLPADVKELKKSPKEKEEKIETEEQTLTLEFTDKSLGGETDVDKLDDEPAENDENETEYKWCMPASLTSEDSSSTTSSDDEKTKFTNPIVTNGHKFSDGIVWETIEECDESSGDTIEEMDGGEDVESIRKLVNKGFDLGTDSFTDRYKITICKIVQHFLSINEIK